MSFKDGVFLWIFCLYDLPMNVNGLLNSSTVTWLMSVSPLRSANICFRHLVTSLMSVNSCV